MWANTWLWKHFHVDMNIPASGTQSKAVWLYYIHEIHPQVYYLLYANHIAQKLQCWHKCKWINIKFCERTFYWENEMKLWLNALIYITQFIQLIKENWIEWQVWKGKHSLTWAKDNFITIKGCLNANAYLHWFKIEKAAGCCLNNEQLSAAVLFALCDIVQYLDLNVYGSD